MQQQLEEAKRMLDERDGIIYNVCIYSLQYLSPN